MSSGSEKTAISTDFVSMRVSILDWLESLRVKTVSSYGIYRFCNNGNPTLMSSCFSVFIRELLNDLDSLSDKDRVSWIQYIRKSQDANTGLFIDPLFKEKDLVGKHNSDYFLQQNTMFCLSALNALGSEPAHRVRILDSYPDSSSIVTWLNQLDWSKPWLISNNVMFLMYFLLDDYERNNSEKSLELLNVIFDYLDKTQDNKTGYWGTNRGADLFNGMAGAFHFYFFYFYEHRQISFHEKIIDHTLALQNNDGLFTSMGGGGHCDDLDAIDILIKFSLVSDYRSNDIKNSLMKAFDQIMKNQNSDGGFCYAKIPRYTFDDWIYCLRLLTPVDNLNLKTRSRMIAKKIGSQLLYNKVRIWTWRYSSWKLMSCQINQSDIWSTYFRLFALALISSCYRMNFVAVPHWKFRQYGLGWHCTNLS